ncbi:MAG: branched-chain amino acid ABC transporter permease [Nitrospinota bacterium]
MTDLIQVMVGGLLWGGMYALIALGLTLIFGVMRVLNVAHGELVMLGGYVTYWLFQLAGLHPLLTLLVSMPVLFGLGVLLQKFFISRTVGQPELSSLLLTFGIGILIVNLAQYFWTTDFRSVPYYSGSFSLWGIGLPQARVIGFALALGITVAAFAFLKTTRIGKAIRATSENRQVAQVCGIDVRRIDRLTFGLGGALAGAAGSLVIIILAIYPEVGPQLTLKAFAIVVLGGLGSYFGAFLGGLIMGLAEALAGYVIAANIEDAVSYLILVLVLLVRPSGLLGVKE